MKETKIGQDAMEFFREVEDMTYSDKIHHLMMLLSKYAHLAKADVELTRQDFDSAISRAKSLMVDNSANITLKGSETPLHPTQIANFHIVEATIGVLNKHDCFKRVPKFIKKER